MAAAVAAAVRQVRRVAAAGAAGAARLFSNRRLLKDGMDGEGALEDPLAQPRRIRRRGEMRRNASDDVGVCTPTCRRATPWPETRLSNGATMKRT